MERSRPVYRLGRPRPDPRRCPAGCSRRAPAGVAPPPAEPGAQRELLADPRYALLAPQALPRSESLRDVTARLLPYWYDTIVPDLRTGAVVLVVSHGNTLRALVAHLDQVPVEEIPDLEVPNGVPLVYHLDNDLCSLAQPAAARPA